MRLSESDYQDAWREAFIPEPRWRRWLPRLRLPAFRVWEGERMYRGWGVAWREPARDIAIQLPIPLNLLAGAWRRWFWIPVWHRAMRGLTNRWEMQEAQIRGLQRRCKALDDARSDLEREFRIAFRVVRRQEDELRKLRR